MRTDRSPQTDDGWRLLRALRTASVGARYIWTAEAAFRQEAVIFALSIPLAFWIAEPVLALVLIGSGVMVLIAEVLNTAIEVTIDRISLERHPLSGAAKDLGALAVCLSLGFAALSWAVALGKAIL
ncbi:diacylglycerol kinase [Litorisediminicola beolgyonensis]|uniref:Diacylglycerol kinase n=1 Tax=Litorisediminicola beolgyonensis TaxID=1173614 RepID=A0ABW3ZDG9_9RHOB